MAKTLEFRGIGKSFPGVRALDNVNFIAEGGKVLALLGENGAGKSTLLKILSGDLKELEPFSGDANNIQGVFVIRGNNSALKFYQHQGLNIQKYGMEVIL